VAASPQATRFLIGPGQIPPEARSAPQPVLAVGVPVSDTCKEVVDGLVRRTVPRETLVDLRGPWLLWRATLSQALERLGPDASPEDPLELCRLAGLRIRVFVQG
jgi:2-C-methyl-D-erythritol 4-phosphate cytidylyltransferase